MVLISPAERDPVILALGQVSSLPERWGVDVAWIARGRKWGVQRKEVKDLQSSVEDGRLGRELQQARAVGCQLILVIEGTFTFTTDGTVIGDGWGRKWTRRMLWAVEASVQAQGGWVLQSRNPTETAECCQGMYEWTAKDKHSGLVARPGPTGMWGTSPTDRDWGVHLLTGFPGIGTGIAGAVFDHFGRVPLKWDVTREEMLGVDGVGKGRVDKLFRALGQDQVEEG